MVGWARTMTSGLEMEECSKGQSRQPILQQYLPAKLVIIDFYTLYLPIRYIIVLYTSESRGMYCFCTTPVSGF
jgi:hypothetical protein